MLIVFWGIHGIARYYWLQKDRTLDLPFVREEVLSPLAQEMRLKSIKLANWSLTLAGSNVDRKFSCQAIRVNDSR
jgi:hypothetical protein